MSIAERLKAHRIVPVVRIEELTAANGLADALIIGGLPCIEITLRSKPALDVVRTLAARNDILLGVGTVLNVEQAEASVAAGAQFLVSPGIDEDVVNWSLNNNITIFPGVATPTDIQKALQLGIKIVKFFPAEAFGGIKSIDALGNAFQEIKFMPTGGINPENLMSYLSHPQVIACGGSWMVKPQWIHEHRFDLIEEATKKAVAV